MGNLFADIFAQQDSLDVAFTASGAIRGTELGPLVTMSDLKKIYPYDDTLYKFKVTGAVLTKIFTHNMRLENRIPGESVYLQVSKGVEAVYRDAEEKLESLTIHGQPVQDNTQYTIAIDNYRYQNAFYWLGVTEEELTQLGNSKVITTSCQDVLEEYFGSHQNLNSQIEGRLVYK